MGISFEPNTSPRGTLPLSHTFLQVNNTACREKNLLKPALKPLMAEEMKSKSLTNNDNNTNTKLKM